jgi:hypothetical protein
MPIQISAFPVPPYSFSDQLLLARLDASFGDYLVAAPLGDCVSALSFGDDFDAISEFKRAVAVENINAGSAHARARGSQTEPRVGPIISIFGRSEERSQGARVGQ